MLLVYSLPDCKWCILAKRLLDHAEIAYKVKEIDIRKKQDFKNAMRFKTFPLIFNIKGKKQIRIGGYQELEALLGIRKKLKERDIPLKTFQEFHRLLGSLRDNEQLRTLFDMNYVMIKNNLIEEQIGAIF